MNAVGVEEAVVTVIVLVNVVEAALVCVTVVCKLMSDEAHASHRSRLTGPPEMTVVCVILSVVTVCTVVTVPVVVTVGVVCAFRQHGLSIGSSQDFGPKLTLVLVVLVSVAVTVGVVAVVGVVKPAQVLHAAERPAYP